MEINELKTHFYASHPETASAEPSQQVQEQQIAEQQEDNSKDTQSNKWRSSSILDKLLDPSYIDFPAPNHDDHLLVKNFDVTTAFHMLQLSIRYHKWKLSLDNHIHSVMVASFILFLPQDQYLEDLTSYFPEDDLNATVNHIDALYGIKKPRLSMEVVNKMINIIEDITIGTTSRENAIVRLLQLDLLPIEKKFNMAIIEMVRRLPRVSNAENANEFELSTRYIDDPDQGVFLRWTNETILEAPKHEGFSIFRPDLTISSLHGTKWKTTYGYGEAKSAAQGTNNFLICQDLLRVAILCKEALDLQNMEGVLGLQIIGRTITFYVAVLPATCLYVMRELANIKVPDCLDDLIKLIMDMPQALLVLDMFNRVCVPSVDPPMPTRRRPTVTTTVLNGILSSSQDRKRSCLLKRHRN